VELGEPGCNAGAHRRGGGVSGVSRQLFQGEDLGVLRRVDLPESGA